MTVAVLTLQFVGSGWTIESADGALKIDAEQACIDKTCKPTGDVTVDPRGMWFLASADIDMRWASPTTVEYRTATGSWTPAEVKGIPTPKTLPADSIVETVTRWDRGVLPGYWTAGTDGCGTSTTAWLYTPLLDKAPASRVVGGKVSEGGRVEACKGAEVPGIHPPK